MIKAPAMGAGAKLTDAAPVGAFVFRPNAQRESNKNPDQG
jgi:hypothetical protein